MQTQFAEIQDLKAYTEHMSRGLMDKMFFTDKILPDMILDFGCADGILLDALSPWYPDVEFIGYDTDPKMVELARARFTKQPRYFITDQWQDEVMPRVVGAQNAGRKVAVVLSSIIHEIYHYQEPHEVDRFWRRIFGDGEELVTDLREPFRGFDFIVIRDMVPSQTIDRPSDITDLARVYRKFLHTSQLHDFENVWGSLENNRQLTHFLLKYSYVEPNWAREVRENYFPLYREDLLAMIPVNYAVMYHEHFILPFIRRSVRQDFGIQMKDPTHLKLILERE